MMRDEATTDHSSKKNNDKGSKKNLIFSRSRLRGIAPIMTQALLFQGMLGFLLCMSQELQGAIPPPKKGEQQEGRMQNNIFCNPPHAIILLATQ
jgi:hypothetical protein